MDNKLQTRHHILPYIFIPFCILIIASYGHIGVATITGKPGLNANLYSYYELTKLQFCIYNFTIALIGCLLIFFQLKYIIRDKPKPLDKTFWAVAIFIMLLLLLENYLDARFISKG